jgi:thymidine kinase
MMEIDERFFAPEVAEALVILGSTNKISPASFDCAAAARCTYSLVALGDVAQSNGQSVSIGCHPTFVKRCFLLMMAE